MTCVRWESGQGRCQCWLHCSSIVLLEEVQLPSGGLREEMVPRSGDGPRVWDLLSCVSRFTHPQILLHLIHHQSS